MAGKQRPFVAFPLLLLQLVLLGAASVLHAHEFDFYAAVNRFHPDHHQYDREGAARLVVHLPVTAFLADAVVQLPAVEFYVADRYGAQLNVGERALLNATLLPSKDMRRLPEEVFPPNFTVVEPQNQAGFFRGLLLLGPNAGKHTIRFVLTPGNLEAKVDIAVYPNAEPSRLSWVQRPSSFFNYHTPLTTQPVVRLVDAGGNTCPVGNGSVEVVVHATLWSALPPYAPLAGARIADGVVPVVAGIAEFDSLRVIVDEGTAFSSVQLRVSYTFRLGNGALTTLHVSAWLNASNCAWTPELFASVVPDRARIGQNVTLTITGSVFPHDERANFRCRYGNYTIVPHFVDECTLLCRLTPSLWGRGRYPLVAPLGLSLDGLQYGYTPLTWLFRFLGPARGIRVSFLPWRGRADHLLDDALVQRRALRASRFPSASHQQIANIYARESDDPILTREVVDDAAAVGLADGDENAYDQANPDPLAPRPLLVVIDPRGRTRLPNISIVLLDARGAALLRHSSDIYDINITISPSQEYVRLAMSGDASRLVIGNGVFVVNTAVITGTPADREYTLSVEVSRCDSPECRTKSTPFLGYLPIRLVWTEDTGCMLSPQIDRVSSDGCLDFAFQGRGMARCRTSEVITVTVIGAYFGYRGAMVRNGFTDCTDVVHDKELPGSKLYARCLISSGETNTVTVEREDHRYFISPPLLEPNPPVEIDLVEGCPVNEPPSVSKCDSVSPTRITVHGKRFGKKPEISVVAFVADFGTERDLSLKEELACTNVVVMTADSATSERSVASCQLQNAFGEALMVQVTNTENVERTLSSTVSVSYAIASGSFCPRDKTNTFCSAHGQCTFATGTCVCYVNVPSPGSSEPVFWTGEACDACIAGYFGSNCAGKCRACVKGLCNNGTTGDGSCTCDSGFAGELCDQYCPGGSATPCTGNGKCGTNQTTGAPVCTCYANSSHGYWGGELCDKCAVGYGAEGCKTACPKFAGLVCNGGSCNADARCVCLTGSCGPFCNLTGEVNCPVCAFGLFGNGCNLQCPGYRNESGIVSVCSGHGACSGGQSGSGLCNCSQGYAGKNCSIACIPSADNPCSGNGDCSPLTGKCTCKKGYALADCSLPCPGLLAGGTACTGHGECNLAVGTCQCRTGFALRDCSAECPGGSQYPCSGHGACQQLTNECTCSKNDESGHFAGKMCDVCAEDWFGVKCNTQCGKGLNSANVLQACSGHGICVLVGPESVQCRCFTDIRGSWNISGANKSCDTCAYGYWGPNCTSQCKGSACAPCSHHGTCSQGRDGTGDCACYTNSSEEQSGFWDGPSCAVCAADYWDSSCMSACPRGGPENRTCTGRGECSDGLTGEGTCNCTDTYGGFNCASCARGYYGRNCASKCPKTTPFTSPETYCNRGRCNETEGATEPCVCDSGNGGWDCSSACPGKVGDNSFCYGHGECAFNGAVMTCILCNVPKSASDGCWDKDKDCGSCFPGYFGENCTQICPGASPVPADASAASLCSNTSRTFCSGHGTCDHGTRRLGTCACRNGWFGPACAGVCPGGALTPCSGHGVCDTTTGLCKCNNDTTTGYFATDDCSACQPEYAGFTCKIACPKNNGAICSGRGKCSEGVCECDTLFCGETCEKSEACTPCDPFQFGPVCTPCPGCPSSGPCTEAQACSGNGACSQGRTGIGGCHCNAGFRGLNCELRCPGESVPCSGHGNCTATPTNDGVYCGCDEGWATASCNTTCGGVPSSSPSFANVCSGHGNCIQENATCKCTYGYGGPACEIACPLGVDNAICSGITHGKCRTEDGTCECVALESGNWSGPRCSECADGYVGIACEKPCKNGYTRDNSRTAPKDTRCICNRFWKGETCDEQCPGVIRTGENTFAACNGHGQCSDGRDGTGECTCGPDYYNANCSKHCTPGDCSVSLTNAQCNVDTGECECQLNVSGYWALNVITKRCDICDGDYFGEKCDLRCMCNGHGVCNRRTGACQCFDTDTLGYWAGKVCDRCDERYVGIECRGNNLRTSRIGAFSASFANVALGEQNGLIIVDDVTGDKYIGTNPIGIINAQGQKMGSVDLGPTTVARRGVLLSSTEMCIVAETAASYRLVYVDRTTFTVTSEITVPFLTASTGDMSGGKDRRMVVSSARDAPDFERDRQRWEEDRSPAIRPRSSTNSETIRMDEFEFEGALPPKAIANEVGVPASFEDHFDGYMPRRRQMDTLQNSAPTSGSNATLALTPILFSSTALLLPFSFGRILYMNLLDKGQPPTALDTGFSELRDVAVTSNDTLLLLGVPEGQTRWEISEVTGSNLRTVGPNVTLRPFRSFGASIWPNISTQCKTCDAVRVFVGGNRAVVVMVTATNVKGVTKPGLHLASFRLNLAETSGGPGAAGAAATAMPLSESQPTQTPVPFRNSQQLGQQHQHDSRRLEQAQASSSPGPTSTTETGGGGGGAAALLDTDCRTAYVWPVPATVTAFAWDPLMFLGFVALSPSGKPSVILKFELSDCRVTGQVVLSVVGVEQESAIGMLALSGSRALEVLAPLTGTQRAITLSLFVVRSIEPTVADTQGGTRITVRGEGFIRDMLCLFDLRRVKSEYVSSRELVCAAPPGGSDSCIGENVEIYQEKAGKTTNKVKLRRVPSAAVTSATSVLTNRPVVNISGGTVRVLGSGFGQDTDLIKCKVFSPGQRENESIIVNATNATAFELFCELPPRTTAIPKPSYLEVSVDGQVFSTRKTEFDVIAGPGALFIETVSVPVRSAILTNIPAILVAVADEAFHPLKGHFVDTVQRTIDVTLDMVHPRGKEPIVNLTDPKNRLLVKTTLEGITTVRVNDSEANFAHISVKNAVVGLLSLKFIEFPSGWHRTFEIEVKEGVPHSLRFLRAPSNVTNNQAPTLASQPVVGVRDVSENDLSELPPTLKTVNVYWAYHALDGSPVQRNTTVTATNAAFHIEGISMTGKHEESYYIYVTAPGLPENTSTLVSEAIKVAKCADDHYALRNTTKCIPCPSRGVCDGRFDVRARDNWWRADNTTLAFYYCGAPYSGDSCFNNSQCREGYHGPRCSECAPGYGRSGLTCSVCPTIGPNSALLGFVVVLIVVVVAGIVYSVATGSSEDLLPVAFRNFITYAQILSRLGDLQMPWPALLQTLWAILNKFEIQGVDLSPIDCAFGASFYDKHLILMVLPWALVIAACPAAYVWCRGHRRTDALSAEALVLAAECHSATPEETVGRIKEARIKARERAARQFQNSAASEEEGDGQDASHSAGDKNTSGKPGVAAVGADAGAGGNGDSHNVSSVLNRARLRNIASGVAGGGRHARSRGPRHDGEGNEATTEDDMDEDPELEEESDEAVKARVMHAQGIVQVRSSRFSFSTIATVTAVVVFSLTYPTLTQGSGSVLMCEEMDLGKEGIVSVAVRDRTTRCDSPEYAVNALVAVVMLFIYGATIPGFLIGTVIVFTKLGGVVRARAVFAFLMNGLKSDLWFWEAVTMVRKLLSMLVIVFVRDPKLQIIAYMWSLMAGFLLQVNFAPFTNPRIHAVESLSHSCLIATVNLVLLFFFLDPSEMNSDARWFSISVIVLMVNAVAVFAYAYVMGHFGLKRFRAWRSGEALEARHAALEVRLAVLRGEVAAVRAARDERTRLRAEMTELDARLAALGVHSDDDNDGDAERAPQLLAQPSAALQNWRFPDDDAIDAAADHDANTNKNETDENSGLGEKARRRRRGRPAGVVEGELFEASLSGALRFESGDSDEDRESAQSRSEILSPDASGRLHLERFAAFGLSGAKHATGDRESADVDDPSEKATSAAAAAAATSAQGIAVRGRSRAGVWNTGIAAGDAADKNRKTASNDGSSSSSSSQGRGDDNEDALVVAGRAVHFNSSVAVSLPTAAAVAYAARQRRAPAESATAAAIAVAASSGLFDFLPVNNALLPLPTARLPRGPLSGSPSASLAGGRAGAGAGLVPAAGGWRPTSTRARAGETGSDGTGSRGDAGGGVAPLSAWDDYLGGFGGDGIGIPRDLDFDFDSDGGGGGGGGGGDDYGDFPVSRLEETPVPLHHHAALLQAFGENPDSCSTETDDDDGGADGTNTEGVAALSTDANAAPTTTGGGAGGGRTTQAGTPRGASARRLRILPSGAGVGVGASGDGSRPSPSSNIAGGAVGNSSSGDAVAAPYLPTTLTAEALRSLEGMAGRGGGGRFGRGGMGGGGGGGGGGFGAFRTLFGSAAKPFPEWRPPGLPSNAVVDWAQRAAVAAAEPIADEVVVFDFEEPAASPSVVLGAMAAADPSSVPNPLAAPSLTFDAAFFGAEDAGGDLDVFAVGAASAAAAAAAAQKAEAAKAFDNDTASWALVPAVAANNPLLPRRGHASAGSAWDWGRGLSAEADATSFGGTRHRPNSGPKRVFLPKAFAAAVGDSDGDGSGSGGSGKGPKGGKDAVVDDAGTMAARFDPNRPGAAGRDTRTAQVEGTSATTSFFPELPGFAASLALAMAPTFPTATMRRAGGGYGGGVSDPNSERALALALAAAAGHGSKNNRGADVSDFNPFAPTTAATTTTGEPLGRGGARVTTGTPAVSGAGAPTASGTHARRSIWAGSRTRAGSEAFPHLADNSASTVAVGLLPSATSVVSPTAAAAASEIAPTGTSAFGGFGGAFVAAFGEPLDNDDDVGASSDQGVGDAVSFALGVGNASGAAASRGARLCASPPPPMERRALDSAALARLLGDGDGDGDGDGGAGVGLSATPALRVGRAGRTQARRDRPQQGGGSHGVSATAAGGSSLFPGVQSALREVESPLVRSVSASTTTRDTHFKYHSDDNDFAEGDLGRNAADRSNPFANVGTPILPDSAASMPSGVFTAEAASDPWAAAPHRGSVCDTRSALVVTPPALSSLAPETRRSDSADAGLTRGTFENEGASEAERLTQPLPLFPPVPDPVPPPAPEAVAKAVASVRATPAVSAPAKKRFGFGASASAGQKGKKATKEEKAGAETGKKDTKSPQANPLAVTTPGDTPPVSPFSEGLDALHAAAAEAPDTPGTAALGLPSGGGGGAAGTKNKSRAAVFDPLVLAAGLATPVVPTATATTTDIGQRRNSRGDETTGARRAGVIRPAATTAALAACLGGESGRGDDDDGVDIADDLDFGAALGMGLDASGGSHNDPAPTDVAPGVGARNSLPGERAAAVAARRRSSLSAGLDRRSSLGRGRASPAASHFIDVGAFAQSGGGGNDGGDNDSGVAATAVAREDLFGGFHAFGGAAALFDAIGDPSRTDREADALAEALAAGRRSVTSSQGGAGAERLAQRPSVVRNPFLPPSAAAMALASRSGSTVDGVGSAADSLAPSPRALESELAVPAAAEPVDLVGSTNAMQAVAVASARRRGSLNESPVLPALSVLPAPPQAGATGGSAFARRAARRRPHGAAASAAVPGAGTSETDSTKGSVSASSGVDDPKPMALGVTVVAASVADDATPERVPAPSSAFKRAQAQAKKRSARFAGEDPPVVALTPSTEGDDAGGAMPARGEPNRPPVASALEERGPEALPAEPTPHAATPAKQSASTGLRARKAATEEKPARRSAFGTRAKRRTENDAAPTTGSPPSSDVLPPSMPGTAFGFFVADNDDGLDGES